jgi:hypothetical protein
MYGMNKHTPQRNYFATIRTTDGCSCWEHVRTNLGRKVAYAMIAKHWKGEGKIENFRDDDTATDYDREGLERGSEGVLRKPTFRLTGGESRYYSLS